MEANGTPSAVAPVVVPPLPMESPDCLLQDEIRTVYISGFPKDVKDRELCNMLRWFPGYEASKLDFKWKSPIGFALFSSQQYAFSAMDALQFLDFDTCFDCVLYAEIANKNLTVERGIAVVPNGIYHAPPLILQMPCPMPAHMAALSSFMTIPNSKSNPPCNTLYIGNLCENVNEEELKGLFCTQPGYKQMKISRQSVCFIEFDMVFSAINALHSFQGAVNPSSLSGRLHIQKSRGINVLCYDADSRICRGLELNDYSLDIHHQMV